MKLAVDAMGGDHAPEVVVDGAAEALRHFGNIEKLLLVGDEAQIRPLWDKTGLGAARVEIIHAPSVVTMHDLSTAPLRGKKDSSIAIGAELVKQGAADGLVSAGHTGASVAVTTVKWRMIPGVERPGICSPLPAQHGTTQLLDAGANVEAKVEHLVAYAVMGSAYCQSLHGIEKPRVGLMSVGEEDHKGTDFTREVFAQLKQAPVNFVGNVEGHDLFNSKVDLIVCDGFTGNVILKSVEATAKIMFHWLREELTASPWRKLGAVMAKKGFLAVKERGNYEAYGGSPLLGVNGICIIGHGSSTARAIMNMIRVGAEAVDARVNQKIEEKMAELGRVSASTTATEATDQIAATE